MDGRARPGRGCRSPHPAGSAAGRPARGRPVDAGGRGDAGHALGRSPVPIVGADARDRSRLRRAAPWSRRSAPAMLNVMSALPSASVTSSANGATGTSSGTLTRATSGGGVDGDDRGPEPPAVGADHGEAVQPREAVGGRGHQTTFGHRHPHQGDDPVAGVGLQLHHGVAGRLGRRRDRHAPHGERGQWGCPARCRWRWSPWADRRPGRSARSPRPRRPGWRRRRSGSWCRGWRIPARRVSAARGGARRQLARVPPEAVVGVDPAAQRGVGRRTVALPESSVSGPSSGGSSGVGVTW